MRKTATDAWRTLVPVPGDRHGPLAPLLVVLTVVSGLVDAFSYLALGHVFVANMTGNVVFLAFALCGAKGFSIGSSAAALVAFVLGAVFSGRLATRLAPRRGRMLGATAAGQVVLVAASVVVGWSVGHPGAGATRYALIGLQGLAMGMQAGTARRLAVPDLNTVVLTQTIAGTAVDSRPAGGTGSQVGRRGVGVLAMFIGALVGALCQLHLAEPVGLVVVLVLLVPVAVAATHLSRSRPPWDLAV